MDMRAIIDNAIKNVVNEQGYDRRITRLDHDKELNYLKLNSDPFDNRMIKIKEPPRVKHKELE